MFWPDETIRSNSYPYNDKVIPLAMAVSKGHIDITKALIDYGIDVL
jgi:hypothetical protein